MCQQISDLELLRQFRQVAHLQYSRCGPAKGQGWILMSLFEHGDMTQRELAAVAQRAPATLCEQLETMEKAGLILRKKSAADKRHVEVSLTEAGIRAARETIQERQRIAARLFAPLDAAEREELYALLQKLGDAWSKSTVAGIGEGKTT